MRLRVAVAFVLAALLCLLGSPVSAVIILKKGDRQQIRGYLIDENNIRVKFMELLPTGETRERTIPRISIVNLIIAVDRELLATLRPDNPAGYREYAEELVDKRRDPDAHVTAIRLYLIAAYLKPKELGPSCLLGMSALARSPAEERRFRAMGYLLDAEHQRSLLKPPVMTVPGLVSLQENDRAMLRNLLRLLRSRRHREAGNMLNRSTVREQIERLEPALTLEELNEAARPTSVLSPPLLRKILAVELMLSNAPPPVTDAAENARPWSQIVAGGSVKPVRFLSLDTLTEFDPREQYFRDGQWVAAASDSADEE